MRGTVFFHVALAMTILGLGLLSAVAFAEEETLITGAGASFPYPIYSKWAYKYEQLTGVKLNYQSIGSGGGIAQIKVKTIDFGASDEPLKDADLRDAGLVQFPMIVGGVVPVVNIPGVRPGDLKLDGETLVAILFGKIRTWNDEAVRKLNPGLALPDSPITVVYRADKSGTTWIYTSYLAKVSKEWQERVGASKAVAWPTGTGGKGNEGVANYVKQLPGAIGYVEFAYALQNNLSHVRLKNRAGNFLQPTIDTFSSAAANADWKNAPGYYMVLIDQPGEDSWPIVGASFILIYTDQTDAKRARAMLEFFDWCMRQGDSLAKDLHYVPLPPEVIDLVETTWRDKVRSGGRTVWTK
ncbi:MAG: phosphate ABC transporter substrate-binding protein PstS [Planctomycetota bacterium]